MNTNYIIDFDSTFVKIEALDTLAEIALKNNPQKETIVNQIKDITNHGMEGKITFTQSLSKRLALFAPTQQNINDLIIILKESITNSVHQNKQWFMNNYNNIYIISGGFNEYIEPIASQFGIQSDHIIANEFVKDDAGTVRGFNQENPLSQHLGKVKAIKLLKLQRPIIVIGDGFTDYQIREQNEANAFFAFTENVSRQSVTQVADEVHSSFNSIIKNSH